MKHLFTFFLLAVFSISVIGQTACNSLDFVSIKYNPFTDTSIVVHVQNSGSEIFSYPGFVILDATGDTLAKEQVNYFGIGQESVHTLAVRPGVHNPSEDFLGELQLFAGFYDTLWCQWPLDQSLCADQPCDSLIIGLDNWGGALVTGDFEWIIRNDMGAVVESGQFTMNANPQYWRQGLCLESGEYTYSLEALTAPSGGGPVISASSSESFGSPTITKYFEWFNDPVTTMEVPFFAYCSASPNGIEGQAVSESDVTVKQDFENNRIISTAPIKSVLIYSSNGQLVSELMPAANYVAIPNLAKGVYVASVLTQKGSVTAKLVIE